MADRVNREHLVSYINRFERMDEEDEGRKADRKELMEEAKEKGLNPKMIKRIVAYRKDPEKFDADNAEFETYKVAGAH